MPPPSLYLLNREHFQRNRSISFFGWVGNESSTTIQNATKNTWILLCILGIWTNFLNINKFVPFLKKQTLNMKMICNTECIGTSQSLNQIFMWNFFLVNGCQKIENKFDHVQVKKKNFLLARIIIYVAWIFHISMDIKKLISKNSICSWKKYDEKQFI